MNNGRFSVNITGVTYSYYIQNKIVLELHPHGKHVFGLLGVLLIASKVRKKLMRSESSEMDLELAHRLIIIKSMS